MDVRTLALRRVVLPFRPGRILGNRSICLLLTQDVTLCFLTQDVTLCFTIHCRTRNMCPHERAFELPQRVDFVKGLGRERSCGYREWRMYRLRRCTSKYAR